MSVASILPYSVGTAVCEGLVKLHRPILILTDECLFSRRNGAWCCWIAGAAAAVDSLRIPALPRGQTGMVSSRRTCHCHRGGEGSRSVRAEGGEGRLHPLPAIAVRRLLLLWSHTRKTFPSLFCEIFASSPCEPLFLPR